MDRSEFLKGRIEVPVVLSADAYTVAGACMSSPKALERSVYNFTNRRSPAEAFPEVAKDSRMVFYGMTEFLRNYLTKRVTHAQVDAAVKFMSTANSFGGPLKFDDKPWRRVVDEFDGYLPIKIEAIREGSVFFPNEPVVQVTSLDKGFGEMAAHIEALMVGMVSIASGRVTICRHWLDRIREWVRHDLGHVSITQADAIARFMIHDFGMRASSCGEESEMLGKAHLLVFHGTDTFNAAYQARTLGAKEPTGTSILALAHRIVQGYEKERDAYENLLKQDTVGSFVADCYDYRSAVENILIPLAKMYDKNTIVARPDSGPYLDHIIFTVRQAIENGFYTKEYEKFIGTRVRYLEGDSMNPNKTELVFRELDKNGFSPVRWGIFGVGGYLRNTPNRDSLSSAYKLCAIGENEPVIKLSNTPAKLSVPGPTLLVRWHDLEKVRPTVYLFKEYHAWKNADRAYVTYYDGSSPDKFFDVCFESFDVTQQRCIDDFDSFTSFSTTNPDFGFNRTCLSENVQTIQNDKMKEFKK